MNGLCGINRCSRSQICKELTAAQRSDLYQLDADDCLLWPADHAGRFTTAAVAPSSFSSSVPFASLIIARSIFKFADRYVIFVSSCFKSRSAWTFKFTLFLFMFCFCLSLCFVCVYVLYVFVFCSGWSVFDGQVGRKSFRPHLNEACQPPWQRLVWSEPTCP